MEIIWMRWWGLVVVWKYRRGCMRRWKGLVDWWGMRCGLI